LKNKTPSPYSEANYYLTRLTLILILAGGFFKLSRLFATLENILVTPPLFSQSLPDTLIISKTINTGQDSYREASETLSGVCAAAAIAWLQQKPTSIEKENLNNWIYDILPNEIKPRAKTKCLEMLAATTEAGRRFEISGLCYAIEAENITPVSLPAQQLLDMIENRAYQKPYTENTDEKINYRQINHLKSNRCTDINQIRKWYLSLIRLMHYKASEPKTFPLSHTTIHPAQFTSHLLKACVTELTLWQKTHAKTAPSIIQGLSSWALFLLSNSGRRDKKGSLRISSAHTYITRFSGMLIDLIRDRDLYTISGEDFIDYYLTVLKSKHNKQISNVLSSLLMFHQFIVFRFGIENIETSELWAFASTEQQISLPQATIITPLQYEWSMNIFDQWIEESKSTDINLWVIKAAKIILILQYRFYIRTGEAERLRLTDIQLKQKTPHIRIATTSYGKTKSKAGNRIIPSLGRLTDLESNFITSWMLEIEALWSQNKPSNALLFPQQGNLKLPIDRYCIVQLICIALRHTSAQQNARPHSCRHSGYSYQLLSAELSTIKHDQLSRYGALSNLGKASQSNLRGAWTHTAESSYRITNELSSVIGHASAITSISHYFHLSPLILQNISDQLWVSLSVKKQAELANIDYANLRKKLSREEDKSNDARYIINTLDKSNTNKKTLKFQTSEVPTLPNIGQLKNSFSIFDMAKFIISLHNKIPAHALATVYNLSYQKTGTILNTLIDIQNQTGISILNNEILLNSYEGCALELPSILKVRQFNSDLADFQKKQLNFCLQKIHCLQSTDFKVLAETHDLFIKGYRQQQNDLSFDSLADANKYLNFIHISGIGIPTVKITHRVLPGYNYNANNIYLSEIIPTLNTNKKNIQSETIEISLFRKPLTFNVKVENKSISNRVLSSTLWNAFIISKLHYTHIN